MTDWIEQLDYTGSQCIHLNPALWNWHSSRREHWNLWIGLTGTGGMIVGEERFEVNPGFAIFLHPEDSIKADKKSSAMMQNIGLHFHLLNPEAMKCAERFVKSPARIRHLEAVREMARYIEYLRETSGSETLEERGILARQIVRIFERDHRMGPEDPIDHLIRMQVQEIRRDFRVERSVVELAEEVGISASQYTRRFKELMKCAPREYVVQGRIDAARVLLRDSTLSVEQIADSLGYKDLSYFSRQFRQKSGVSPLNFRQAGRE